jgi:hypothetical protein
MDICQKYLDALSDGSYENMSAGEKKDFEQNLKQNPDCLEEFEKMKKTLLIVKENKMPDPGEKYWDTFYDRMETRLDAPSTPKSHWPLLMRAAAFIIGGIFIGYLLFDKPADIAIDNTSHNPDIKQAALVQKTADMLEDSKVLLLGIANFSSPDSGSEKIDFSFQQEMSNTLLLQTADLKKQLAKSKNRRVIRLISDLEIILMQIANLEEEFDLPAIEMIRDGANEQSILFKINMERMLLDARKEQQTDKSNTKTNREI